MNEYIQRLKEDIQEICERYDIPCTIRKEYQNDY